MSLDVFISYSRRDQEFVSRLALDLESRGASVWIDRGDIQGGEKWRNSIADGITAAVAFLLVISPDSLASRYVAEELALAFKLRKPVIPAVYRRARLQPALQAQLRDYQFLNFDRGSYEDNLADLVLALQRLGIDLHQAAELTPEERAERRRERLSGRTNTRWGATMLRVPGWAITWGVGWAIFWVVLLLASAVLTSGELDSDFLWAPVGGFAGGLVGGALAGLFTMVALRRNAGSIGWAHMWPSARIWAIVGPAGVILAGVAVLLLYDTSSNLASDLDCTGLSFGECLGQGIGASIGSAIATALAIVLLLILYSLLVVFGLGLVSGWLAVQHIRRLEPGILLTSTFWVLAGWGMGAVTAALTGLVVIAVLADS